MTVTTSTHNISARLATADDLPTLVARESQAASGNAEQSMALQSEGDYYLVVGLIDGAIAGHAALDFRASNELRPEVKNLFVYPEARRKGLGAVISEFLEEQAAALGYDEIFLGVTPDNPAAIPMYISLDYSPTGEHRSAINLAVLEPVGDQLLTDENEPTEAIYRKSLRMS